MPQIKVICVGWTDLEGKVHHCEKVIKMAKMGQEEYDKFKQLLGGREPVSHGLCEECYKKRIGMSGG